MIAPITPQNEADRQRAVEKYQLLDTLPEHTYDDITSLIAAICEVPIALITLLDKERNFLKSHHGVPFNESPRELSFCGHAIVSEEPIMIVEDAREDVRFQGNPLVKEHKAIFYAGVPLVDPDGFKLGTLCIYDEKPRSLTPLQIEAMQKMAKQVVRLFEARYQRFRLEEYSDRLEDKMEGLNKFASVVSHDLKSPLAQITQLLELLEMETGPSLSEQAKEYIALMRSSSGSLRAYIDGILSYYKFNKELEVAKEWVHTETLMKEVFSLFPNQQKSISIVSNVPAEMYINKPVVSQIWINLISNALNHNDKPNPEVWVSVEEKEGRYECYVKDNGPGIPNKLQDKIFDLFFTTVKAADRERDGTGIGLATVKKAVQKLGGTLTLTSKEGEGSTFFFTLPIHG